MKHTIKATAAIIGIIAAGLLGFAALYMGLLLCRIQNVKPINTTKICRQSK